MAISKNKEQRQKSSLIESAATAGQVAQAVCNPDGTNIGAGGATTDVNLTKVGGAAFALGQQLAAASLPIVLTAAQITTLTPTTISKSSGAVDANTQRVTQGSTSMQSQGLDTTGQDAYATVKTPSADATHIFVSCGSFGATISLNAGTTDHFSVQPNMAVTLDAVTITSGVAIQAKNLVPGSNYTNLAVSIW